MHGQKNIKFSMSVSLCVETSNHRMIFMISDVEGFLEKLVFSFQVLLNSDISNRYVFEDPLEFLCTS